MPLPPQAHGLQDKEERELINCDAYVKRLAGGRERIKFVDIPALIQPMLLPAEPAVIRYEINVNTATRFKQVVYDVEVEVVSVGTVSSAARRPWHNLLLPASEASLGRAPRHLTLIHLDLDTLCCACVCVCACVYVYVRLRVWVDLDLDLGLGLGVHVCVCLYVDLFRNT